MILTNKATQILRNGMIKQINATWRHGRNAPSRRTMNVPIVPVIPAIDIKLPRTDGSL